MKLLLSLVVMILFAVSPILSQTRKSSRTKAKRPAQPVRSVPIPTFDEPPPPPPPLKASGKESLSSDVFKDVTIAKWSVLGISLPQDLTNETESSTPTTNKDVSWVTYSRSWKQAPEYFPSALEASLTVTTWNTDFKTVIPDLKPELATPENLILIDLIGDTKNKNTPGSFVKEAYPLKINEVEGGFFQADYPSDNKRFTAGWYTYRYFEGRAQRISLTITGRKDELSKAMKIIQSLKLQ